MRKRRKNLCFAAKIPLDITLSSKALASCYFWQKSWFSDDTTPTPKETIFSDKELFPEPLITLLKDEASDVTPSPSQGHLL